MKRYSTTYSNGHTVESSSAFEAFNWSKQDDQQTFALSGKPVSAAVFHSAVNKATQAYYDKKNQTHKQVRVLHGSSVASYVTKWVAV